MIKKILLLGIFFLIVSILASLYLPTYLPKYKTKILQILPEKFVLLSRIIFKNNIINYEINNHNANFLPKTQFIELNLEKKKINSIFKTSGNYPFLLEIYKNDIMLIDYAGNFSFTKYEQINNKNNKILKRKIIKSNLKTNEFDKLLDTLIIDDHIYVSYINKTESCQYYAIKSAKIDNKYLDFNKFFISDECGKFLQAARMQFFIHNKTKGILFTTGDNVQDEPNNSAQDNKSIFGKILFINLINKNYFIFSKGHRNAQGLYAQNNLILSTEHGPRGGDEINKIEFNNNYGWPISSYGENYFRSNNKKNKSKNNKIYIQRFFKNHQDYDFTEPLFSFVPSIGISELIKLPNNFSKIWENNYLISSLNGKSLFRIKFDKNYTRVIFFEKIIIGQRIRDLKYNKKMNAILLALENNGDLGVIKIDGTGSTLSYK